MNVLIDTCAMIWAVAEPDRLTEEERRILEDQNTSVFFSPISAAEMACLSERGRVTFDRPWREWVDHFVNLNGWLCLDSTLAIIEEAFSLPGEFHRDPTDRIIVATARTHRLTVVTGDSKIIDYPHVETTR